MTASAARHAAPSDHPAGCRCAACAVEAAVTLLSTGRAAMALRLLDPLPPVLRETATASADLAHLRAQAEGQRLASQVLDREIARDHAELRRLEDAIAERRKTLARLTRPPRPGLAPKPLRPHERLAAALTAGTVTADRVAALLRVRPGDVAGIAAGRASLPTSSWRKIMAEIGE